MTLRSPYIPWYVNSAIKSFCQCDITTIKLPEKNAYGETEYLHVLHHAHFDRYGWPTELIYQLDKKFPEFRLRFV